jgi:hypothetical protein
LHLVFACQTNAPAWQSAFVYGPVKNLLWQKAFDMDFPQEVFGGVFELPLLRNARSHENAIWQQRSQKVTQKKEAPASCTAYAIPHLVFSGYLPDIRRFQLNIS